MSVSQVSVSLSAEEAGVLVLVLLPHLAAAVDRAEASGGLVSIWVHATAGGAACPDCGTWCTAVRLLRCGNAECPRGSFAGQPEGLAGQGRRPGWCGCQASVTSR
jgi:hypothetical protein